MAAKDDLGRAGEERAVRYLTTCGYEILDRNWRCAQGEIDIVASDAGVLCVVEVKTRRSIAFGHPFEAVDARKLRRLWQLAHAWIDAHPERPRVPRVRLEAIGIVGADVDAGTLEHLRDLT
ncbi:YraN family protein [Microbacterium sp.]|uniref:YraN family protein n=1 Tax=Microbacterium sp. TaxID=51671 RepID=UPI0039E4A635